MIRRIPYASLLLVALSVTACDDDDPTAPRLDAPTGVQAVATSPTSVDVTFNAVSGAASYRVERAEGASTAFAQVGTTSTTSFTDGDVDPETTYAYRVAAAAGSRVSSFSSSVSVVTPTEGPRAATIAADLTADRTLYADTLYTLSGFIKVPAGVTLTIEPGTVIHGDYDVLGSSLFVLRGGKIMACGTADAPIVFTSSRPEGERRPGDWGGLILVGNGEINRGDPTILEGTGTGASNPDVNYGGGNDNTDSSGELCYVRVEFAGYATAPDAELNSFTFAAVGSGTKAEYLQAMSGLDDHYEWFGGAVDHRYLVSYESGDDHYDASEGYIGRVQHLIAYQSKVLDPRTGAGNVSSDPQGFEIDGCAGANCLNGQDSEPLTQPVFANFTLVGTGPGVVDATSGGHGAVIRRGTAGFWVNGVLARWPKAAISLRDETTAAHLTAGDLGISHIASIDNNGLLHTSSFSAVLDTTANNIRSIAGNAASVFTTLPTDPSSPTDFDWSIAGAADAFISTGGLDAFTGELAARAGDFITPTSYLGAADPAGPKWWEGWTNYADN